MSIMAKNKTFSESCKEKRPSIRPGLVLFTLVHCSQLGQTATV